MENTRGRNNQAATEYLTNIAKAMDPQLLGFLSGQH